MKTLSIPSEENLGSLDYSRAYTKINIKKWLKDYEIAIWILTMFTIGLGMSLVPMKWYPFGILIAGVIGGSLGELFEEAKPQVKRKFWDILKDQTS
ncbi:MAG: hypothetical protein AAB377_00695 [Patescibacteria group bacterium]